MKKRQNKLYFRELGAIIRRHRNRARLSVEKAALEAGISDTQWKRIEASSRFPSIRSLEAICRVVDVGIDEILEEVVSFRAFITSVIDRKLITLAIVRDGSQEPWEVTPCEAGKMPDDEKLSAKKQTMIKEGWISGDEEVIARLSNIDEIEAWKNYVSDSIESGHMSVDGEGLSEILETSFWVSPRFNESRTQRRHFSIEWIPNPNSRFETIGSAHYVHLPLESRHSVLHP